MSTRRHLRVLTAPRLDELVVDLGFDDEDLARLQHPAARARLREVLSGERRDTAPGGHGATA